MSNTRWKPKVWGTIYRAIQAGKLDRVIKHLDEDPKALGMVGPFGPWLHVAAKEGQVPIMKELVRRGVDIQATGSLNECNALYDAVRKNHYDAAVYLLDLGIETELPGRANKSPLLAAILSGNVKMVQLLIDYGVDTRPKHWSPAAYVKQIGGNPLIYDLLEKTKCRPKSKSKPKPLAPTQSKAKTKAAAATKGKTKAKAGPKTKAKAKGR
jgi:uncharacterized protein